MITFLPRSTSLKKPHIALPPANPQTIGDHIRKKRLESGQLQRDLALLWSVSEDSVTGWENNRSQPQIHLMPHIISYLGYYPFDHSSETPAGQIDRCRHLYGASYKQLGEMLGVDGSTVLHWRSANRISGPDRERSLLDLLKAKQSPC